MFDRTGPAVMQDPPTRQDELVDQLCPARSEDSSAIYTTSNLVNYVCCASYRQVFTPILNLPEDGRHNCCQMMPSVRGDEKDPLVGLERPNCSGHDRRGRYSVASTRESNPADRKSVV